MFSLRYGVTWSVAVPCWCWEGGNSPKAGGLKESLKSELRTLVRQGLPAYDVGFGQCIVSSWDGYKKSEIRASGGGLWQSWLEDHSSLAIGSISVEKANTIFPVASGLGIPVRGLFFLMLLFAVAIGPLNLIVLSRKKRRIWMLWTTPAISLITCLAVFAYATFAEGWNRHARTDGLTLLDERSQRATTIGWTAFYSGLPPSDGLHFGYESELTPLAESMTTNIARHN